MNKNSIISVIVTAHNSRETIAECLHSIAESTVSVPCEVEIILIDDRSQDGTGEAAQVLKLNNLTVFRIDVYSNRFLTSRQIALDLGIRKAKGDILLLTNADARVPQDWILNTYSLLQDEKIDAVAGLVEFRSNKRWLRGVQNVDVRIYFSISRFLNSIGLGSGTYFGNIAFRKNVYFEMGGFEAIGFSLTEDLSFSQRMFRRGYRTFYNSSSIVSVKACPDWKTLLKRTYRVSASRISFFSLIIWAWLLSLPLLLFAALWGNPLVLGLLGFRYMAGVGLVGQAVLRIPSRSLLLYSLIYDFIAIAFGLLVFGKTLLRHKVEWGGISYVR